VCVKKYEGQALLDPAEFFSEVVHIEKSQLSFLSLIGNYETRIILVESTMALEKDKVHLILIENVFTIIIRRI
jgi:hypothetical protein